MPQTDTQDWYPIKQADFSGGVNIIDDPADLSEKEIADTRNVRLTTKNTVEQRMGYTKYNTNAIGATTEIRSLFHFKDFSGALIPLAQCSGDALYKGSAAFPGTAASWTSILSETASSTPAFMDAMWGTFIYTNGVDVPQVWEGTYGKCQGFRVTTDNGATYKDYSARVSDEDPLTYASVGALDDVAAGDWILIKSRVPKLTGIQIVMDGTNVNAETITMEVEYRSAVGVWTTVGVSLSDGTKTGNVTLAKSGDVTWTEITCVPDLIDNSYGYFLRVSSTAGALSATVRIRAVYLYYNIQPLPSFWDGAFIKPDGFVKTVDNDVTYVDYTVFVTDDASSTVAALGALPASGSNGYFYIKSVKKFRAAYITMSVEALHVNTTAASTLKGYFWSGSAWTELTTTATEYAFTDGTSANSITLAQSGLISWKWPTTAEKRRLGQDIDPMYIFRFTSDKVMSTDVDIAEIEIIEAQDALRPMKGHIFHKNRVFMWGRADAPNYLFYSAQYMPDVYTGVDAGYIGIPSGKAITACARFYNDLMVATDDEIYILQGYTPSTFGLLKINTGGIGVSAPHSVVSVGKMIYFMHATGFYRFDGIGIIYLSKSIRKLFDDKETDWIIPPSRYEDVQGRFQRVWSCVEWTITKGDTELMTLDVAPATAWAVGDTITGATSHETCIIVNVLTALTYNVMKRSGTFTTGEVLSNGTYTADQGGSNPTFATNVKNNLVAIFEIDHEGWWFDDMVVSAFLKTEGSTYQDLWYHGDYVGFVYRDYNGTSDNGVAISAYLTTRAQQEPGGAGWTTVVRGVRAKMDVQTAGSLTIAYALSGVKTFTSYGTMLMTGTGYTFVVKDIYDPLIGTAIQFKLSQATLDYTFGLSEFDVFVTPVRSYGPGI